jgi:hypothetical protein
MNKVVRFCYRKIIDINAHKAWERLVFEDSYTEFRMQSQRFNVADDNSFADMLLKNSAAEQLHFLVSSAALGYVQQMDGKIPDVLNTLGRQFMPFINFRFEIINSDIRDVSKHKVAINFFSEPVCWIDTIGSSMLLNINNEKEKNELQTHLLNLQPYLSICSLQTC